MLGEAVTRTRRPSRISVAAVVLAVAAFPLMRPSLLGERFAPVALVLVVVSACLVLLADRDRATWLRTSGVLFVFLGAAQLWAVFRAPYNGIGVSAMITGSVTMLVTVAAFAFLFADRDRTTMFLRSVLWLLAIVSASSLVSAAMAVAGVSIALFEVPITADVTATVYFPLTPTSGVQSVFGFEIPRLTGLGREPGWMAMYAALAWLLWPRVFGVRLRAWRFVLLFGVLTPLSTAGFGIFVVVATFELFLRPRAGASPAVGYFRQLLGVALFLAAIWLSVSAPVLGLEAKTVQNAASLSERNAATLDGLRALETLSLGEESASRIPGVNLIAAVAETGWPYSLLVALAILLPLVVLPTRREALAPIAVIFLTLLLAQPPNESTAVFVFALAAYAISTSPPVAPGSAESRTLGGRAGVVPTMAGGGYRSVGVSGMRMSASGPRRAWTYVGVGVLAAAVALASVIALQPRPVTAATGEREVPGVEDFAGEIPDPTVAVFIGDSYTAGAGGTRGGFVSLVAQGQEWRAVNLGRGGTGYVPKPDQDPAQAQLACARDYCESYPESIGAAVDADPDVVFVSGGRNDLSADPATAAAAATAFFTDLRAALPTARIVVLAPLWDSAPAPAELDALGEAVRTGAELIDAEYLDIGQPLEGHPEWISPDGVHPNDAGYAAIATAVSATL